MLIAVLSLHALLVTTALSIPTAKERFEKRLARRAKEGPQQFPITFLRDNRSNAHEAGRIYNTQWAGVVLSSPSEGRYRSVTAKFTLPHVKQPTGGSGYHAASPWVGIDGRSCDSAILQAGLDISVGKHGEDYHAWYEWYPYTSYDFTGFTFQQGDEVTVTVTATSTTTGTATILNHSNGQAATESIDGPALCEQDAEWIVEDFVYSDKQVPLADFGNIVFTEAEATMVDGTTVGPKFADARILDLLLNGTVYTQTSVDDSSVTVKYTQ